MADENLIFKNDRFYNEKGEEVFIDENLDIKVGGGPNANEVNLNEFVKIGPDGGFVNAGTGDPYTFPENDNKTFTEQQKKNELENVCKFRKN